MLKLQKEVIKWPDEEERKAISAWIKHTHSFVNCVDLIDGTLFPLAFASSQNSEDYFTRKGNCAIKGLFICDDTAKITWIEMGWPIGSRYWPICWKCAKLGIKLQYLFNHLLVVIDCLYIKLQH